MQISMTRKHTTPETRERERPKEKRTIKKWKPLCLQGGGEFPNECGVGGRERRAIRDSNAYIYIYTHICICEKERKTDSWLRGGGRRVGVCMVMGSVAYFWLNLGLFFSFPKKTKGNYFKWWEGEEKAWFDPRNDRDSFFLFALMWTARTTPE